MMDSTVAIATAILQSEQSSACPFLLALMLLHGLILTLTWQGNAITWSTYPFILLISPDSAQRSVVPPLWDGNAQHCARAALLQRAPPPNARECCPFIVHWQHAALCQRCHCKEGLPLTQRRVRFPVLCHGDITVKSTSPFSGGGNPILHDGSKFFILYGYLFILLNNPLPPHQFSCSRTLLRTLMLYPAFDNIFSQGKHGWACNVSFICCGDGKYIILYYFVHISHHSSLFPNLIPWHWQKTPISISRQPLVIVETVKSKSLVVSRDCPAQPFCPDLVLAFAPGHFLGSHLLLILQSGFWQEIRIGLVLASFTNSNHPYSSLFSSLYLCLAPFLWSSILLQLHMVVDIWKE